MGACLNLLGGGLSAEKITERINRFFLGLIARQLGINKILDDIKMKVLSGQISDIEGLKSLLYQDMVNNAFTQTSKEVVRIAMEDARNNYGDITLPFLSILFLSNSNTQNFIEAFKVINLAQHAQSAGSDIHSVVNAGNSGGLFAGISQGLNVMRNVVGTAQQAANPNLIRREDLKKLVCYYTNFITLLPVSILDQCHEGGAVEEYVSKVLCSAFSREVQSNFVENTIFIKYNSQETIDINQFFNDNYPTLSNDSGIRIGLVNSYIETLNPTDIRNLIGGAGAAFC